MNWLVYTPFRAEDDKLPLPPYPLISWSEVPKEDWPAGYDPRDDIFAENV
jgi:hypothetical protein